MLQIDLIVRRNKPVWYGFGIGIVVLKVSYVFKLHSR